MRLERGGDGEADGLFRPGGVGDDQIRAQRIEMALDAFHGGVEALEIDGGIDALLGHKTTSFPAAYA